MPSIIVVAAETLIQSESPIMTTYERPIVEDWRANGTLDAIVLTFYATIHYDPRAVNMTLHIVSLHRVQKSILLKWVRYTWHGCCIRRYIINKMRFEKGSSERARRVINRRLPVIEVEISQNSLRTRSASGRKGWKPAIYICLISETKTKIYFFKIFTWISRSSRQRPLDIHLWSYFGVAKQIYDLY